MTSSPQRLALCGALAVALAGSGGGPALAQDSLAPADTPGAFLGRMQWWTYLTTCAVAHQRSQPAGATGHQAFVVAALERLANDRGLSAEQAVAIIRTDLDAGAPTRVLVAAQGAEPSADPATYARLRGQCDALLAAHRAQ